MPARSFSEPAIEDIVDRPRNALIKAFARLEMLPVNARIARFVTHPGETT